MNRRNFLLASLAAMANAACSEQKKIQQTANVILGGGQFLTAIGAAPSYVFSVVELEKQQTQTAPINFLPHGIHIDPSNTNRIAVFEKRGPNACEFDLKTKSITKTIACKPGRYFYGHGAYSPDGELLYSSETQLDTLQGMIGIRNANDLSYIGEFPSFGIEPHECHLIDDGSTMVVTNGGGKDGESSPSVTYIDVTSQKLIEKITLSHKELNTGHVAISKNGDLVVVSAPRKGLDPTMPGGVSIRPRGSIMQSRTEPKNVTKHMKGEALSVAIDANSEVAAVTHPDGNLLSFWSVKDAKLLKAVDLSSPRGVTTSIDNQFFIVSVREKQKPALLKIRIDTLAFEKSESVANTFITGSHIVNWSAT